MEPGDPADRLDVPRQTVNAIETGRYDPSLPLAFKLAQVFETPIESLFFVDGDEPRPPAARETRKGVAQRR